jgi:putative sterol carrier protein
MAVTTVQEILQQVASVDPSRLESLDVVVLLHLSGEGGGRWTVTVADRAIKIEEGEPASPNLTLSMDARDFVAMYGGELSAMAAFMQGRLKIDGDMTLAMRLQGILT